MAKEKPFIVEPFTPSRGRPSRHSSVGQGTTPRGKLVTSAAKKPAAKKKTKKKTKRK